MMSCPPRLLLLGLLSIQLASACTKSSTSHSKGEARACATPDPTAQTSTQPKLVEDTTPSEDAVKAGALAVGNEMIDTLCEEVKETSGANAAAVVAEGATQEMTTAVGTLVISTGLANVETSAAGIVAAPIIRGAFLQLTDRRAGVSVAAKRVALAKTLVAGASASLNGHTGDLTTEETLQVMSGMAGAAIGALPAAELVGDFAQTSVAAVTQAAVGGLKRAGIETSAVGQGAQKLTEGVVAALSTPGFEPASLGALTGEAAGSAIQGLGAAGLSADQILSEGAIESIISGAVSGLKKNEGNTTSAADAMGAIAGATVSVLGSVGLSTPEMKKSALSSVIKSSMSGAQSLSKEGDDSIAKAMSAVASKAVLALSSGGFKNDQIGTAVSTIVEAGVAEIAKTGITNATLATDIASKLIEGALIGAGSLIKSGALDAQTANDTAVAASTGAVKGLESLQSAGIVTGDSVSTFTNTITSSISSGLEQGGASAAVVANAQSSVSTVIASPEVQGQIQANAGTATPAATPTFSLAAGSYSVALSVVLSTTTSGASIRYTLDGSTPTSSTGTLYSSAISIAASKTLKAIAYKTGWSASAVASVAYTVSIPAFASATTTTTGTNPEGLAAGDFNADGKKDLAVGLYSGKGMSFMLGNGDGTFAAKQDVPSSPNSAGTFSNIMAASVAVDDLNGDNKPDIVWGAWGDNYVSVLTNTTSSNASVLTFAGGQPTGYNPGISGPRGVAITDVDADGFKDIVVGEANGNKLIIYTNQSGTPGTFVKFGTYFLFNPDNSIYNGNAYPWMVVVADFNADGKPDVVGGGGFGGIASVILNNTVTSGSPNFQTANRVNTNTALGCTANASLSVNDFNGDGKPDIVFSCPTSGTDKVAIFSNSTGMAATAAVFTVSSFDVDEGLVALTSGDVDGDGSADILTITSGSPAALNLYRGHGDGTFAVAETVSLGSGTGPNRVALVDVNGDGRLDAVVTYGTSNKVAVLLNQL